MSPAFARQLGAAIRASGIDNDKLGLCRGSGVFRRMEGQWWIMQYNLSIPVPNDLAERVVGMIKQNPPKAPEGERKHPE